MDSIPVGQLLAQKMGRARFPHDFQLSFILKIMDDYSLDPYTFTEEDQINAAHFCRRTTRRPISRRRPTYINLTVGLNGHWAAVQIVITPSLHPQLAKQTIFSLHYRYGLCCRSISGEVADERIRRTVQDVVGAYFFLFEWDFSDENCYTRDLASSRRVSNTSCLSIAHAILSNYSASAERTARTTGEPSAEIDHGETRYTGIKRPRLGTATESRSRLGTATESRPRLGTTTESHRLKSGATNLSPLRDQSPPSDEKITEMLVQKIRKGLLQCGQQLLEPNFQQNVLDTFLLLDNGPRDSYEHYATKLEEIADMLEQQAQIKRNGSWYTRFLAGCITVASPSLPTRSADSSSGTLSNDHIKTARQGSAARIVNMIVSGLWDDWHEKAFLVYHAFAAINYKFRYTQPLGYDRLSKIAHGTVEMLKVEVPNFTLGGVLFDPSRMLCQLLKLGNYQGMCDALKLPPLQDTDSNRISSNHDRSAAGGPLIVALSEGLTGGLQPQRHLTGRANSTPPQSPYTGHSLHSIDTCVGSSMERQASGSQAQEIQTSGSQAAPLSARYDLNAVETPSTEPYDRQVSNPQAASLSMEPNPGIEILPYFEPFEETHISGSQAASLSLEPNPGIEILPFFEPFEETQASGSQAASLSMEPGPGIEILPFFEPFEETQTIGSQASPFMGPDSGIEILSYFDPFEETQTSGSQPASLPIGPGLDTEFVCFTETHRCV